MFFGGLGSQLTTTLAVGVDNVSFHTFVADLVSFDWEVRVLALFNGAEVIGPCVGGLVAGNIGARSWHNTVVVESCTKSTVVTGGACFGLSPSFVVIVVESRLASHGVLVQEEAVVAPLAQTSIDKQAIA